MRDLCAGELFGKYLPFTMAMLMQAAASPIPEDVSNLPKMLSVRSPAIINPVISQADYETVENVHRLRESVLEAITGIIQGVKGNPEMLATGLMQNNYAQQIMEFLKGQS
jgi:hypothetical protein